MGKYPVGGFYRFDRVYIFLIDGQGRAFGVAGNIWKLYIASVMLVDEENFMEKSYLDELARQLKLEPGLKVELEKQVRQASI